VLWRASRGYAETSHSEETLGVLCAR
jgi:hypothetical protein